MINASHVKTRLEQTFPFLQNDTNGFRDRFMRTAVLARLDKGEHICREGAECTHLALVLEGTARVYKLGENGREITLYRVEPGESCILTASCILSHAPFPAFAVCEAPVTGALIPTAEVQRWMAESALWRDYIFGLVTHRLTDIISVVEEVVFRRVDRRIAAYLSKRLGATPIKTTHQAIASDLGTSREVVSRILKEFESEGIIEVARGTVTITDANALQRKSLAS